MYHRPCCLYMYVSSFVFILDWFHITKRITVLNQFAKGMAHSDPEDGAKMIKDLESIKWYLWHGNVKEALDHLEDCWLICEYEETKYQHKIGGNRNPHVHDSNKNTSKYPSKLI